MQTKAKAILRRGTAAVLALAMGALFTVPVFASGADDTLHVGSVSDLKELARNCSLDTWSAGKMVSLDADIDVGGSGFTLIPTFSGTFEGNGHTISGIDLTDQLAPAGVFGWVDASGVVQNLHVEGDYMPDGDRVIIGGIVGRNFGTIKACSFNGSAEGLKQVGGIAGINEEGGRIENCTVEGDITARTEAGGIAGENNGNITGCTNRGKVNTEVQESETDDVLSNLSDRFKGLIENGTVDSENITMDVGGIAGYSSGQISGCSNEGEVGHLYVGYNVGGIAGRSDGLIMLSENHGTVLGNKDVGGIAGQAAPDLELNLSAGTIQQLSDELDKLKDLVDSAADTADANSDTMHNSLKRLSDYLNQASSSADTMYDGVTDWADDAADEAQRVADILDESIDRIKKIKDDAQPAIDNMDGTLDKLSKILYQLAIESGVAAIATGTMTAASFSAGSSVSTLEDSLSLLQSGASMMVPGELTADATTAQKAIQVANQLGGLANVLTSLNGIDKVINIGSGSSLTSNEIAALSKSLTAQGYTSDQIYQSLLAYQKLYGGLGMTQQQVGSIASQLTGASSALSAASGAAGVAGALLKGFDTTTTLSGIANVASSLNTLIDAMPDLKSSLTLAGVSLGTLTVDGVALGLTLAQLGKLTGTLAKSVEMAQPAIDEAKDLLDYWADQPDIHIPRMDQSVRDSGDTLMSSFTGVTEEVATLTDELYDTTGDLTDQIRDISDQTSVISDLLIDALNKMGDPDASNYFHDISEDSASDSALGQILQSSNDGEVNGDLNVGGIAGTQGIESLIDADDDLGGLSLNGLTGVYESRAVLRGCTNTGTVTSRKGAAGSVCGQETVGLIDSCYGYGFVESQDGEAVGGIAGLCTASVKNSWAKCFISGNTYVGGIIGRGEDNDILGLSCTVSDCRSMVQISDAEQYYGAIAGESTGDFTGNLFVSDELSGLDYRSVTGAAEPVTYEDMIALENAPEAFRTLTLMFRTDEGEVLKTMGFEYGTSFGDDVWPEAPEVEGSYVRWDKTDLSDLRNDTVVTAVYTPYVLTLGSADTREPAKEGEDARTVFYVEGRFEDGDALTTASEQPSEDALAAAGIDASETEDTEQWTLTIPDDGASNHTVRYLPTGGSASGTKVYAHTADGSWVELDTTVSGSYVSFDIDGSETELLFHTRDVELETWMLAPLGIVIAALVGAGFIRRKKKKNANASGSDNTAELTETNATAEEPIETTIGEDNK